MADFWFYPKEIDEQPKVTAYIFDSHRPFFHGNVNDSSKCIQCVDDGCKSFAECPTEEDMQEYQELMQEAQSDDDSDLDESDNIDDENGQEGTEQNENANEDLDLAEL